MPDKKIETLVDDIYRTLEEGVEDVNLGTYGKEQDDILSKRLAIGGAYEPRLRLSSIGKPCVRQLWYELYTPDEGESLRPSTRLKFLYGDIIETMLLQLVRQSGHVVTGEQDEIFVDGIRGHRDCIIDGMLVDIKSASSYSFKKFKGGLQRDEDAFGYLTQLGSYLLGSQKDDKVTYKNEAAFLVVDKVTGSLCLDRHTFTEKALDWLYHFICSRKSFLKDTTLGCPQREYEAVPEGKSGNLKLSVNCSYCPFKTECWPELRTFIYSGNKPVFLTHVEREPNVPELLD